MKRNIFMIGLMLMLLLPLTALAQTSPDDPAIQQAKEETAVVFDLGRFFSYLNTMEKESPRLALSRTQLEEIYQVMSKLKSIKRIEPDEAEEMLVHMEDEVLTPDQLMEVDQLAIARMEERAVQSTKGSGSGGGQITSYIAGGPFNPVADPSRTIGKDFITFFEYVSRKLGK